MHNYDWPGNVRELQNIIERAVIVSKGKRLQLDLESAASEFQMPQPSTARQDRSQILTESEMREFERQNIEMAPNACAGKIYGPQGAARLLGLPPTTLAARINKLAIKKG